MSEGLNLVTLFGNLGAEPELKASAKGPVLKMRLATEHSWFNKETNDREKKTEWHNLTMFGARAEAVAKYLHKGSRLMVKGHLQTNSFDKDGQKHYRTEVIVDELCFGGGRSNGSFLPAPREAMLASGDLPF
ncbi:MAG TPA: single-stranded DNA-binding protein [Labilithrix sp.]|jgi:single-strand DNA-binding protein|nr:single-stranded DNA-binding protein [Labilithrix sp.]